METVNCIPFDCNAGHELDSQQLICEHCGDQFTFEVLLHHTYNCDSRLITCACGDVTEACAMQSHKKLDCNLTEIECPLFALQCCMSTCYGLILRGQLDAHIAMDSTNAVKRLLIINKPNRVKKRKTSVIPLLPEDVFYCPTLSEQPYFTTTSHVSSDTTRETIANTVTDTLSSREAVTTIGCQKARKQDASLRRRYVNSKLSTADVDENVLSTNTVNYAESASLGCNANINTAPTNNVINEKMNGMYRSTYVGERNVSKHMHGKGKLVIQYQGNVVTYDGEFEKNWRHGVGTYKKVFKSGDWFEYVGDFERDIKSGHGTMTYSNGDVYTGDWAHNKIHGYGTMTYADGRVYEGLWKKEKKVGMEYDVDR